MGRACLGPPVNRTCNAQVCTGTFPWPEVCDLRNAWILKHEGKFEVYRRRIKAAMASFDEGHSPNLIAFRSIEIDNTLAAAANLHVFKGPVMPRKWLSQRECIEQCSRDDGLAQPLPGDDGAKKREAVLASRTWNLAEESPHIDGSAGDFIFTYTHSGLRFLKMVPAGSDSHYHLVQRPGSVWIANASAFRHQAIHVPAEEHELTPFGDFADLSLSVGRPFSAGWGGGAGPGRSERLALTIGRCPGLILPRGCSSPVGPTWWCGFGPRGCSSLVGLRQWRSRNGKSSMPKRRRQ